MKYFRIKNWDKYQYRKKDLKEGRPPLPWIMLHRNILRSEEWIMSSDTNKAVMITLLCMADDQGYIRDDPEMIRRCGGLYHKPKLSSFFKSGFLVECDGYKDSDCAVSLQSSQNREEYSYIREDDMKTASSSIEGNGFDQTAITELWNKHAEVKVKGFFPRRMDLIVNAWREQPSIEYWESIFKSCAKSSFLNSKKKKWKTTLEWAMQHHVEILEGKFNDENEHRKEEQRRLLASHLR